MTDELHNKWPARLLELLDFAEAEFIKDHPPETARNLAERAAFAVAEVCGGHPIYMPMATDLKRALRNKGLYEKFNGTNFDKLADETGMSESQIRKVLKLQHQIEVAKRQRSLI